MSFTCQLLWRCYIKFFTDSLKIFEARVGIVMLYGCLTITQLSLTLGVTACKSRIVSRWVSRHRCSRTTQHTARPHQDTAEAHHYSGVTQMSGPGQTGPGKLLWAESCNIDGAVLSSNGVRRFRRWRQQQAVLHWAAAWLGEQLEQLWSAAGSSWLRTAWLANCTSSI